MPLDLEPVIGLETHLELSTATKLFCRCANDPFGSEPNAHTCPVCMGFPGALPVLNAAAVEKALRMSVALGFTIRDHAVFSRKNYFYPDLPMGYQISMYQQPVAEHGQLRIMRADGSEQVVRIERLHLENDAGKLTHVDAGTLLDFNRAGSPLIEVVSAPDMHSSEEAYLYAKELQTIARAVDASDADMEQGKMRFDASVSLRPRGETKLYPRAEIKNLNSFRSLRNAITYEIARQQKLWEAGEVPTKEMTVGWLDDAQKTVFMRWKETADDYRYFDEPDLPPLQLSHERVEQIRADLPELPHDRRRRYVEEYGLDQHLAATLSEPALAAFFDAAVQGAKNPKIIANWLGTVLLGKLSEEGGAAVIRIAPDGLRALADAVDAGQVSTTSAKELLVAPDVWSGDIAPMAYVEQHGLAQVQDDSIVESACAAAIAALPKTADDVRAGRMQAIGALVGHVMKETRGKVNAAKAQEALKRLLAS